MIPKLTASIVYSKLGNNSSLVPLAIKDVANSCGMTAASYASGDKHEGKDRFIDEFGTQAIWLWGIPTYKKTLDLTLFKAKNLDPAVDVRILKNPEILKVAQEFAPTESIKNSLKEVAQHQKTFKSLTVMKFAISTILTALTYLGLTKFRHKYTENQIKKEYLEKQKNKNVSFEKSTQQVPFSSAFADVHQNNKKANSKNVAFTGGVQDFIFDPVKNLMLVDGAITGERFSHARNGQDFFNYVLKEGGFWGFMYFAGPLISKAMEKHADRIGKPIDLDARVIFGKDMEQSLKDGSFKSYIETFKKADTSDVDLYKYAVNPDNENLVIKLAKKSDIIGTVKDSESIVDTRKYIDLKNLRGISEKMEKLLNNFENSGESLEDFLNSVRKMKKLSVLKNIGACIGALGILVPAIMLITRQFNPDFQLKKDIEKKLETSTNNN